MKISAIVLSLMSLTGANSCGSDPAIQAVSTDMKPEKVVTMADNKIGSNKIESLPPLTSGGQDAAVFSDTCVIRIDLGSIGTGIDRDAERRVVDFIEDTDSILKAYRQGYGKEGEVAYCLDVSRDVNSVRVLKNMREAVGDARIGTLNMKIIADY